jgi:hypothetical protein
MSNRPTAGIVTPVQEQRSTLNAPPQRATYESSPEDGCPAGKPTAYDWRVGTYTLVSGIAGAAQIIAATAQHFAPRRMRPVIRNARYIGICGTAVGALLLASDLKTPGRWCGTLRIFRTTSAMSIGSYILTAFGTASLVTAVGEALRRHPAAACAAHIAQLPAAAAGAGMLSYTGALLSSTSIPLWASESPLLAARFAASGMAAGAAALSIAEQIGGRPASAAPLNYLMLASNKAYALISHKAHQRHRAAGVAASLREGPYGPLYKLGGALIVALPAGLHLIALVAGRRWRVLPMISAVSVLAGVALTRHAYLQAGSASANGRTDNPG